MTQVREQAPTRNTVAPPPAPAAVRVDGVTQVFERGRPPVLEGVDLTVAAGEFVCLLGASGCGKSTLLNLVAGLATPTAGRVEVSAERPALMFQEPALLPWLTARGNVELALKARGVARGARRTEAERLLELVNLGSHGAKRVHELSGGMRQRVALARALAQDSSVLLMDEPFAALDAITRDVLHEELTRVWTEQQLSVVFVTHNVREAVRLGQRVVLMSSRPGRIVREWQVDIPHPRAIESPAVGALASEITAELHREISRHGR
ncbi:ATP-binding cassette domain-containing protein [Modestobacter sp. I12A-02628]|uniref:ABC transporter ATP-binding protein n=1 Tax=Goekera deserti TaxID=2497753 RepID=A0A7K3WJD8_9ACTN|nr:ABC transporter ATP-binding protein [Goekera deserti]MPQ99992.1 ATP-binding cassette domain-containing protein [Goekera deserti]NDI49771.1 ATP-binding cassette domain-containing protein [Goekera deserti]NEL56621.1 ABC transporter ATP-binding protein [Goekera deserti]